MADVGPRAGVAGVEVLVLAHALAGGEGNSFAGHAGSQAVRLMLSQREVDLSDFLNDAGQFSVQSH